MRKVRALTVKLGTRLAEQVVGVLLAVLPAKYREHLERLKEHSALGVVLSVEQVRPPATNSQRGYFHAVLPGAAKAFGMEPDELKLEVKRAAFGEQEVSTPFGTMMRVKSSTKADREQYSHMLETLMRLSTEMIGYQIPPPRDNQRAS